MADVPTPPRPASPPPRDRVQPETLNVAPAVLDLPLARPGRRAAAMLVDVLLLGVLSVLANLWLIAGLALLAAERLRADTGRPTRRARWWLAAAPLLAVGVYQGLASPSLSLRERATEASDAGEAADQAIAQALARAASAVAASTPPVAGDAAPNAVTRALAQRVATLEAALAERRDPPTPLDRLRRWLDDVGPGYGGALLYFTLLPAWWGGRTPGKRLLGLRVVELTGAPVTATLSLRRFGGYAAGLATGGIGLAQLLWDRNRQALQDRCAHTVVVDERASQRQRP